MFNHTVMTMEIGYSSPWFAHYFLQQYQQAAMVSYTAYEVYNHLDTMPLCCLSRTILQERNPNMLRYKGFEKSRKICDIIPAQGLLTETDLV